MKRAIAYFFTVFCFWIVLLVLSASAEAANIVSAARGGFKSVYASVTSPVSQTTVYTSPSTCKKAHITVFAYNISMTGANYYDLSIGSLTAAMQFYVSAANTIWSNVTNAQVASSSGNAGIKIAEFDIGPGEAVKMSGFATISGLFRFMILEEY
jgi:hypothetical protein